MKKLITTLCIIFATLGAALGQGNIDSLMQAINADYQKHVARYSEHYDAKEFDRSAAVLKETIAMLENLCLSPSEREKLPSSLDWAKSNTYYNLACSQSLLGKKREAVDAFGKAIDLGYSNYRHALGDSDLDPLRRDKRFVAQMERLSQRDKLTILQKSGGYEAASRDSMPRFTYQKASNNHLKSVREYFRLDTLGGVDEIDRIKRLLLFATDVVEWDGMNAPRCSRDAIDLYNYHKVTGKGVNCRMKATMLNEFYLAMGYPSRFVACMPASEDDTECHVINCVWSRTLGKWLWMDPSHGIYVTDGVENLLSIAEVRERLREGKPLALGAEAREGKEWYLDSYMAKNLYWFTCPNVSRFNTESYYRLEDLKYISLIPSGFDRSNTYLQRHTTTHDPDYFWQAPPETK